MNAFIFLAAIQKAEAGLASLCEHRAEMVLAQCLFQ